MPQGGGGGLLPLPRPMQHNAQKQQQQHQNKAPYIPVGMNYAPQKAAPNAGAQGASRTKKQTEHLKKQLYEIFERAQVDQILVNHPCEMSLEKLSSYVLDSQSR